MLLIGSHHLNQKETTDVRSLTLRKVHYEIHEGYLQHSKPTWANEFYRIQNVMSRPRARSINADVLFQTRLYLCDKGLKFFRHPYTFEDLMSEMGGFAKTIMYGINIFLIPFSTFFFYIQTIQQIFMKIENKNTNDFDSNGYPQEKNKNGQEYFQ